MKNFKHYIVEEKNTHMMHIENALLYTGVKGTERALVALRDLYKMLSGTKAEGKTVTQKWDGAPAVFAGPDPITGEFFVAKKGIFNKNPVVYKSEADVRADTSGDLAEKLVACFKYLKGLNLKTIIQGDLMFTQSDLETETIDGKSYVTFQPNTIVYAIPADSDFGKKLKAYKLGIVFHTEYTGDSYESLKANYNINVNQYKGNKDVWVEDAYVKDLSGKVLLNPAEAKEVEQQLNMADKLFASANKNTLKEIEADQDLARDIETFQNSFVRAGVEVVNTTKHVKDLINWYTERFSKEREARKSEKGKEAVTAREQKRMEFFSPSNQKDLKVLFDLQRAMVIAKTLLFRQLDRLNSLSTFVRTKEGFKVTGSEGFVIVDKLEGKAYKVVDRLEFSKNNFSKDIIKSWER